MPRFSYAGKQAVLARLMGLDKGQGLANAGGCGARRRRIPTSIPGSMVGKDSEGRVLRHVFWLSGVHVVRRPGAGFIR